MDSLQFTLRDGIIAAPFVAGLVGIWLRLEIRTARLETSMEDVKRIVLNGKKPPTPRKRK